MLSVKVTTRSKTLLETNPLPADSNTRAHLGEQLQWDVISSSNFPTINQGEVHVWSVPLQLDAKQTEQGLSCLNEHQQDRYHRRIEALRQPYLAGRFYLLHLLSHYTGASPEAISLKYSRLSKPFLDPNPDGIAFNFTDSLNESEGLGLYAFFRGSEIGVDIEALARRGNFEAIAKRKFSTREQHLTRSSTGDLDPTKFLALWTRKEAYGKATGVGVNFRMNQLDLASPDLHQLSFSVADNPTQFQLHQFMVFDSHVASVVYTSEHALELKAFTLS